MSSYEMQNMNAMEVSLFCAKYGDLVDMPKDKVDLLRDAFIKDLRARNAFVEDQKKHGLTSSYWRKVSNPHHGFGPREQAIEAECERLHQEYLNAHENLLGIEECLGWAREYRLVI